MGCSNDPESYSLPGGSGFVISVIEIVSVPLQSEHIPQTATRRRLA